MSMTVSVVNTNGIPYEQHGTDKQKAKAEKFINMTNAETTRMAVKNYNKRYREDDKKFAGKLKTAVKSVPLIAVASSLALKQGGKAALRNGASWGLALAIPVLIGKANDAAIKASPKLNEFEQKHGALTIVTGLAASIGAFFGAEALMDKAISSPKMLAHPKVKQFTNNLKEGADNFIGSIKKHVKVPKKLKNLGEKFKMPEKLSAGFEKLKNAKTTKSILSSAKNIGKKVIEKAPALTMFAILGSVLYKVGQESTRIAGIKSNIRNAQMEKAKDLINAYSAENESLKQANAAAGEKLSTAETPDDNE